MQRFNMMRLAAVISACAAFSLPGCGGGGSSSSMLPVSQNTGSTNNTQTKGATTATLSITGLPAKTSSTGSRVAALSTKSRSPQYIDTTTANSALVVSVTPQDPAEAAQYGNLTICYNLYTNGTITSGGNGLTVAAGPPMTVTLAFPAPPGTDGFQITQYAGQCGSTPYTLPSPSPGASNGGLLSQTPVVYANLVAGSNNGINAEIGACTQPVTPPTGGSGFSCVGPGTGVGTIVSSIAIAGIQFGALPISSPVREQGAFLLATGKVGVPIPLEGINAAGTVIPGLTTIVNPNGGAGPFPSGVVVKTSDPTNTALFLVDATNGGIAQAETTPGAGLTIHEFNALSGAVATGGNDITFGGSTAVAGDPWVIILTTNGKDASVSGPVTVTATATIPPATTATSITTTISPQSAVYTAVAAGPTGYVDAAAPTAGLGLIQTATNTYVTDGGTIKIDGTATVSAPAAGTALGGITSATWPNATNFIYAVDSAQATGASTTEVASGLYAFNPVTLASVPVSAAAGANNYIQFPNPVAVVQALGTSGSGHPYLFVIDKNGGIYRVDISGASEVAPIGGFQEATNVLPTIATTGTAISPGANKYLGTTALASGLFLVADPGNNRIAQVDATQNPAVITSYATCPSCTGLFPGATAGSLYATSSTGQIYYISGTAATAVSMGFALGTAIDGPIGQFASLTPTATPTLTPVNYPLQFQTGSFFSQTAATTPWSAPYNVAPFANPTNSQVFAAAPVAGVGLKADTSAGATTGAGLIKATGGIVVVPASATASAVVTPDSIEFIDATGKLRTIVR
jgi:hypothetical protein